MSVDRDYSIRVSTIADNAAVQQTAQGLKDVGKATGQAGEEAAKFNTHGREMHRVFGELNRIAPGLGEVLHGILSPEAAPIVGLIIAFELLAKLFAKINQDAADFKKTMESAPDFSGVKNSVESIATSLADADRKAQDFLSSMAQIETAQQTIADNSARMTTALEHQKTVEDQIAAAKKEQVAAELELMKQKGQITPEQYDLAKIQLESVSAREAAQREVAYLQKEKEQTEHDRATAQGNVDQLGQREKAAQERAAAADNNLKQAQQRHDVEKQKFDAVTKEIVGTKDAPGLQEKADTFRGKMDSQLEGMSDAELRAYLGKLKGAGANTTIEESGYRDQIEKYLQLADKLQDERQQQSGFAGKVRASEGQIEAAKNEQEAANRATAELNKQLTDNSNSVKTLAAKIIELNQKLDQHKDDSKVLEAQDRARRAQALPGLEKDLGVDTPQGAADFTQKYLGAVASHNQGRGTAADEQTIQQMQILRQATKESDTRLLNLIQDLIRDKGDLARALADMKERTRNELVHIRGSITGQ